MRLPSPYMILAVVVGGTPYASAQSDAFSLPPGMHRDLLIQNCIACHSDRLITQTHLTRKA